MFSARNTSKSYVACTYIINRVSNTSRHWC